MAILLLDLFFFGGLLRIFSGDSSAIYLARTEALALAMESEWPTTLPVEVFTITALFPLLYAFQGMVIPSLSK